MKTKFIFLGKTDYISCLDLQKKLSDGKKKGKIKEDFILITEHFPIYTLGKTTKKEDLPKESNLNLVQLERGGSITFHGEEQIVVYPILDLQRRKLSVKKYIFKLENIILQTLNNLNINAYRIDNLTGIFTDLGKIGFIGVYISKYITIHGFSINYNVKKDYFYNIKPCGLNDRRVANITDFRSISKAKFLNELYRNLRKEF